MKKITLKFLLASILTSVLLIVNAGDWSRKYDEYTHSQNIWLGIGMLLLIILGYFIQVKMAQITSYNSNDDFSIFEVFFLGILFLFSFTSTILISNMAFDIIFRALDSYKEYKNSFMAFFIVSSLLLVAVEVYLLMTERKKPPKHEKAYKRLYQFYSGVVITICWNMVIIGGGNHISISSLRLLDELIVGLLMAFFIIFSYQRFYWYEILGTSKSIKDGLVVIGSIFILIICAILPMLRP